MATLRLNQSDERTYKVRYDDDHDQRSEQVKAAYFQTDNSGELVLFKSFEHRTVLAARLFNILSIRDISDESIQAADV